MTQDNGSNVHGGLVVGEAAPSPFAIVPCTDKPRPRPREAGSLLRVTQQGRGRAGRDQDEEPGTSGSHSSLGQQGQGTARLPAAETSSDALGWS